MLSASARARSSSTPRPSAHAGAALGQPDDLGPAAVFLADPTQIFHTGDMLVVDGGYTVF